MTSTTLSRMTAAVTLGAAVTTLVLLLMQSLIRSDSPQVDEPPPGATLTFLPKIEEVPPQREKPRPKQPDDPVQPPPLPELAHDHTFTTGDGFGFSRPVVEDPGGPTAGGALMDGDALPVVKVRPVYPARAEQRGIEGHVLVQFTIDQLGRVVDAQVVESQPRGMFEHAAMKAVERFRYKPRVVNGEAVSVSGVQHLVTFELGS